MKRRGSFSTENKGEDVFLSRVFSWGKIPQIRRGYPSLISGVSDPLTEAGRVPDPLAGDGIPGYRDTGTVKLQDGPVLTVR